MQRVCRTTSTNHSFSESIKKQGVVSKSKSRSGIEALLREFRDRTYGRRETLTVGETAGLTPETRLSFISLKDGVCTENHDQPRSIDHYLPQEGRNYYGATMLASMYLLLRGTPHV